MIARALVEDEKQGKLRRRRALAGRRWLRPPASPRAACASTRATGETLWARHSALRLDEPAAWARYEVRRTSFIKRLAWDDLTSGTSWQTRYQGTPVSWITWQGLCPGWQRDHELPRCGGGGRRKGEEARAAAPSDDYGDGQRSVTLVGGGPCLALGPRAGCTDSENASTAPTPLPHTVAARRHPCEDARLVYRDDRSH